LYARGVYSIADAFGRVQAGDLQFDAWYEQWTKNLGDADRAAWKQLRGAEGAALIAVEISVSSDPTITGPHESAPGARADIRKQLIRFADSPNRPASDVCADYLRLAKRFAGEFLRDYARFLP
jgi:hypothetical protein